MKSSLYKPGRIMIAIPASTSSSSDNPYESLSYDNEAPPEEVLSNIMIFEEKTDEDYKVSIDGGQMWDFGTVEKSRVDPLRLLLFCLSREL